ncbi:MAG: GNAT family N-acetyltransferase [Betaproteobacteria bacterium]
MITLREINADSVRTICALRVAPGQEVLVAPNAISIAQAYFEPAAWFRAIHADDLPVGFAMLYDPTRAVAPVASDTCYLWRFMIAAPFQRMGHGAAALAQLIDHARTLPNVKKFQLSYAPVDGSPREFYVRLGFHETGEVDDGEIVMGLQL